MSILTDSEKLMLLTGKTISSISSGIVEARIATTTTPEVTFSYLNYTSLTLEVVERSGLKITVHPQKALDRNLQGNFIVEERVSALGIDLVPPANCTFSKGKDTFMVTDPYRQLVALSSKTGSARHSILHSIKESEFVTSTHGILVPLAGITVGRVSGNTKNLFLDNYIGDNEIGASFGLAIKLISSNEALKLFIPIGDRVETITGIDKGYDEDYLEVYRSNSKNVMELVAKVSVRDAMEHGITNLKVFTTEVEALTYASESPNALSEKGSLMDRIDKLERSLEDERVKAAAAARKADEALGTEKEAHRATKAKNESDKSKSRSAAWTKIAAIGTALASLVSSIWSIALRWKT